MLGAFQKYFGHIENMKLSVSKKIFFLFLAECIHIKLAVLRMNPSHVDTMRAIRSKNEFFIFLLAIFFYFFSISTITIFINFTMMNSQKKLEWFHIIYRSKKFFWFVLQRLMQLAFPDKMIVGWGILAWISLFMQWIVFEDISHNAFHNLTWANGYLLFLLIILLLFVTISIRNKQKLKLHSGLQFNDYHIAIIVGILLIILPINSLIFLIGLSTFSEPSYGNGIGLCITSGILVFIGAILKKRQINNGDISAYITSLESEDQVEEISSRDNMKLPF